MAWKESNRVSERILMMQLYDSGAYSVVDLCRHHDVSRETFYVLKRRRDSGDERWFEDRSRAPLRCPQQTSAAAREKIVALRTRFPQWGPKKIRAKLMAQTPGSHWPAASTIGDILKREGLVKTKRRRRRALDQGHIIAGADAPNEEWAIDFKGWFRTKDGTRCDPLTVSDTASRYLIDARIVPPTYNGVRAAMERIFSDVGLPDAIRSDNGAPFGSVGAGGLSKLSVWFLKLGIEPRHIPPGSPQHNGRHERMHRTMKAETARPPAHCPGQQQVRFNLFCDYYNEERPHEALGQSPPADHWQPPERAMPMSLEEPWYDADHEVRKVRRNGTIKWHSREVFIGEALKGEPVGLCEIDSDIYVVRFCDRDLGVIDRDSRFHRFAPPRARLRYTVETAGTNEE